MDKESTASVAEGQLPPLEGFVRRGVGDPTGPPSRSSGLSLERVRGWEWIEGGCGTMTATG